jgi:hypothetical protein
MILGIVVAHLELREEAVRREEHPVQERGSSLFIGSGGCSIADPSDSDQGPAIRFSLKEGGGAGGKICLWRNPPPDAPVEKRYP